MMAAFHKSRNYIGECDSSANGDVLWNGKVLWEQRPPVRNHLHQGQPRHRPGPDQSFDRMASVERIE